MEFCWSTAVGTLLGLSDTRALLVAMKQSQSAFVTQRVFVRFLFTQNVKTNESQSSGPTGGVVYREEQQVVSAW